MENRLKCLVVDDESPAHLVIKAHITRCENLEFVDSVFNGKDAIEKLKDNNYDIVFMDIDMPLFNGIEVMQTLPERPATIITTAYDYFAFDSYQLDAVDYLLKPISFPRFLKAIEKANSFLEAKTKNRESIKSISFRVNSSVQDYLFDNIIYFQSIGNYIKVYLKNPTRSIVIYDSLKSLMENLPHHQFVQSHKSYIVNIDFIQSIGKEQLLLSNASPIPIGRKYELMVNAVLKK